MSLSFINNSSSSLHPVNHSGIPDFSSSNNNQLNIEHLPNGKFIANLEETNPAYLLGEQLRKIADYIATFIPTLSFPGASAEQIMPTPNIFVEGEEEIQNAPLGAKEYTDLTDWNCVTKIRGLETLLKNKDSVGARHKLDKDVIPTIVKAKDRVHAGTLRELCRMLAKLSNLEGRKSYYYYYTNLASEIDNRISDIYDERGEDMNFDQRLSIVRAKDLNGLEIKPYWKF